MSGFWCLGQQPWIAVAMPNIITAGNRPRRKGWRGSACASQDVYNYLCEEEDYMTAPYINGQTIEIEPAAMTPVVNPANGRAFSKVFMARPEHMTRAIDAAYAVKDVWGNTLPSERELILIRAADVLESMRSEVVDLLIEEGGATFGKSQFEVSYVVGVLRSAAGECRRIFGQTIPCDIPGRISMAIRRPLGVVGGIAPFNFPLILATKKVAFALAAGNTFVLKPSEETSLVGLKIAEIFDKAGLPPGVLNVVPGDGPMLGAVLYSDPRVKAILFTGSTAVGRQIGVECAKRGKKFDLEMGGKSPLLVMKDANLQYAVDTACFGLFIHQGQICMAGSCNCRRTRLRTVSRSICGQSEIAQSRRSTRPKHCHWTIDSRFAVPVHCQPHRVIAGAGRTRVVRRHLRRKLLCAHGPRRCDP
jgi:delta 1-pyrroline-5-carboxylate dehydrogenase